MSPNKNMLLVEGATEKRLIPELIEKRGMQWVNGSGQHLVTIKDYGGITNLLAPDEIETALKSSNLEALGLIFDADGMHNEIKRLSAVRDRCAKFGCLLPESLDTSGFVTQLESGVRFGVWMMPNNTDAGMLETFLHSLVPDADSDIYVHSLKAVNDARSLGAKFKDCHLDKAQIHTWLAWQDPPGCQLHEAIKFKVLDATSTKADAFEMWFRNLFID
jgi:hypothetical protein